MDPAEFLDTLKIDVLSPERYSESLAKSFEEFQPEIEALTSASSGGDIQKLLRNLRGRRLVRLLLGSRGMHLTPAEILSELEYLQRNSPVSLEGVIYGALLADSRVGVASMRSRTFRQTVQGSLEEAIVGHSEMDVTVSTRLELGSDRSREFEFLIRRQGIPIAAVVAIFQTISGGVPRNVNIAR